MPLARASKEIPYFDWIFQEGEWEPEWTGSANEWMNVKVGVHNIAAVRMEWMHERRLWDVEYEWKRRREAEWDLPEAKSRRNFDGLVRGVTTHPSDPSQFLNTLLLPSDVCGIKKLWNFPDGSTLRIFWSYTYIHLFLKSLHTLTFPFLYLHWTASIRQRADVLQCLQKRHSPSHEMDWVGFYWASLSAKLIMIKIRWLRDS